VRFQPSVVRNFREFRPGTLLARFKVPDGLDGRPTMVGLSREQRRMFIDRLPDAANMALGALVFGQFIGDRPFSFSVAIFGMVTWASLVATAFMLGRKRAS
jgi:hypothetical protein